MTTTSGHGGEGSVPPARFEKPILSVCVTTFNRGAWLAHSLPRILEQTRAYPDLVEVVVCDNASTDDTPAVSARFRQFPNLRVHRNEVNVGMLGNLGVSANQARGRYVWVIGDDDLMVEGALDRVLAAVALHPDVELIYTNYAYTRFDRPRDLDDVVDVLRGSLPISHQVRDEYATGARAICAKSENCFTAIYCVIFRADHARAAYGQDTGGPPFSSLPTCVPTTHYVLEHLFDRPAYWIGDPCVVVNMNVSWSRYQALYVLERFPEIYDRMEERGAERAQVDAMRTRFIPHLSPWLFQLYFGSQKEHVPSISVERLVRRFGGLPAFEPHWPEIRALYRRAFQEGLAADRSLTPERRDAIREEARAARG